MSPIARHTSAIDLTLSRTGFELSVALALPEQAVTVLYGASGSGKTTVLRCVAGLERATGRIEIAGEVWQDSSRGHFMPTWRRPLGYVFQEASLFEHLDVLGNLEFGLRRSPGHASRQALTEAIELLGIGALLKRAPESLSGGERQRVAIARALATRPQVLLLDEPLAALDLPRRDEVLPWLETLHRQLRLPVLYVTHSAEEMLRLADHLVVLDHGRVAVQGAPGELLTIGHRSLSAGKLIGALLEGQVVALDQDFALCRVEIDGSTLSLPNPGLPIGSSVRMHIAADQVTIARAEGFAPVPQDALACAIIAIEDDPHPALLRARLRCGRQHLMARLTRRLALEIDLRPDTIVWARLNAVVTLPGKSGPLGD